MAPALFSVVILRTVVDLLSCEEVLDRLPVGAGLPDDDVLLMVSLLVTLLVWGWTGGRMGGESALFETLGGETGADLARFNESGGRRNVEVFLLSGEFGRGGLGICEVLLTF